MVEVGAPTGNTVALDKRSGRQRWASRNTDEAGHTAGPVPITVEGVQCVVVLTLRNFVLIQLAIIALGALPKSLWTSFRAQQ